MLIRCNRCHFSHNEDEVTMGKICLGCFRPDPAAIRRVAERLRSYASEAGADGLDLAMETGQIWQGPRLNTWKWPARCQTIACFAGHYFCAKLKELEIHNTEHPWRFGVDPKAGYGDVPRLLHRETKDHAGYQRGAKLLAEDMGFVSQQQLMSWARLHPDWWGGNGGEMMFSSHYAYGKAGGQDLTVPEIASWLKRVAVRIEAEIAAECLKEKQELERLSLVSR